MFQPGQQVTGLIQEESACRSQLNFAVGAVEEAESELRFKLLDLHAQWRLGDEQPFRRPPKVQFLRRLKSRMGIAQSGK